MTGIGTLIATAAAILITLRGVRAQLWLHTFSEYTRRYAEVVTALPTAARNPDGDFDLRQLTSAERDRSTNVVRAYLNLCSEEHYLWSKGKIDRETWAIWTTGMQDMFRLGWFRQSWHEFRSEYRLYPAFEEFFDECLAGGTSESQLARSDKTTSQ